MSSLKEKIVAFLSERGINLSEEVAQATPQKVKCATAALEDGSEIFTESDTWAIGVNVYKTLADGTEEVLADGEYMLADGSKIVVAGGAIAELESPNADTAEAETTTDMSKEFESLLTIVSNLEKEVAALKNQNAELSKERDGLKTELSKTPAAPSITEDKTTVVINQSKSQKPFAQMTHVERVAHILNNK